MIEVGIFEVEEVTRGRWKVLNKLTQVPHVTYGTEAEVREQLEIQSAKWKAKVSGNAPQRESPWRGARLPNPREPGVGQE